MKALLRVSIILAASALTFAQLAQADESDTCFVDARLCPTGQHLFCRTWDGRIEATIISCDGVTQQIILPCVPGPENSNCGAGGT
jgi:hypothetical protein